MTGTDATVSVLHVITAAAHRGAEVHAFELDRAMTALGRSSSLVALHAGPATLDVPTLGPSTLSVRTLYALRRRARSVDVVVAHGSRTLPACTIALAGTGTPFVYRSIGDPDAWIKNVAARLRTGFALRRAARVVSLWDEAAARVAEVHRVPRSRVVVIPNAVAEPRASTVDVPGDGVVALVGALSAEKRPGLALDAARAAGARLVVAGDGPLRPQLEARAAARGQDVQFLGVVTDVTAVYDGCDVLLITSTTEGQPAVLIEAAARGRACVATAVGGIPAMVSDGRSGRLVSTTPSVDEVASAIVDVVGRARAMGLAASAGLGRRALMGTVVRDWLHLVDDVARDERADSSPS